MAYYHNTTNSFAPTLSCGNSDFYPDWSSMLATDVANIPRFDALEDQEWHDLMGGPSNSTPIQNYHGEHQDYRASR